MGRSFRKHREAKEIPPSIKLEKKKIRIFEEEKKRVRVLLRRAGQLVTPE